MTMLIETDLYKFDFRKTHEFFERADIVRKVNGYMQSQIEKEMMSQGKKPQTNDSRNILYAIKEMIRVLAERPEDGKIIVERDQ